MTLRELINQVGEDKLDYELQFKFSEWNNELEEWEHVTEEACDCNIYDVDKQIVLL